MNNVEQIQFVGIHAWELNVQTAYQINEWATLPDAMVMVSALYDEGTVYFVFTSTPKDSETFITGIARMTSDFLGPKRIWPIHGKYSPEPTCNIEWVIKCRVPLRRIRGLGRPTDGSLIKRAAGIGALKRLLPPVSADDSACVQAARALYESSRQRTLFEFAKPNARNAEGPPSARARHAEVPLGANARDASPKRRKLE